MPTEERDQTEPVHGRAPSQSRGKREAKTGASPPSSETTELARGTEHSDSDRAGMGVDAAGPQPAPVSATEERSNAETEASTAPAGAVVSTSEPTARAPEPAGQEPAQTTFDSDEEVRAALAAWTGRQVGNVTPEEGRRRGYRPSGDRALPTGRHGGRDEGRERNQASRHGRRRTDSPAAAATVDTQPTGPEQTGRIKWFNMETGYGFIQPEGGGADIFVHLNQFEERPEQVRHGGRVSFRVGSGRRGRPEAKQVVLHRQANRAQARAQGGQTAPQHPEELGSEPS